jgi:hypothetical protein
MKLMHFLSVIALAAMAASCTVEGPAGPVGPAGQNGGNGANGTANIYSNTYTITSWSTTATTNKWVSINADTNITNLSADAVEVYWSAPSDSGWLSMPHSNLVVSGDELGYGFNTGSVTFIYYGNTNATWPTVAFDTVYFNVVVIPPVMQSKYPGTNWQNAEEVYQKIPEVKAALYNANNR